MKEPYKMNEKELKEYIGLAIKALSNNTVYLDKGILWCDQEFYDKLEENLEL